MKTLFGFVLVLASSHAMGLDISNFKSGLACTDSKTFGWICHETEEIHITGQGRCTWNGEEKACTWHGFQFDYSGNTKDTIIECEYESSAMLNEGNPDEVIADNVDKGSYSFSVDGEEGHFFNPQYFIFAVQPINSSRLYSETTCSVSGKHVFSYKLTAIFPTNEQ